MHGKLLIPGALLCLAIAGCGKPPEDYACTPKEEVGYREELICADGTCEKQAVKVRLYACTNGRDQWMKDN